MVVVDEVLHADQEHVYSSRPFHREVLGIVPGKMEKYLNLYNSQVCEIFMKTQFYHGLLEHLSYKFSGCLTV